MFCIVEYVFTEAATGNVLYTKVFLKFSQNSQESTCARVFIKKETLAQTFSCEFGEIFKNTFFYRTPTVTVSKFKRLVFRIAIELNRVCLVYVFFTFSGSKFLINLRRQFRVRKIFRTQVFAGFAAFILCLRLLS